MSKTKSASKAKGRMGKSEYLEKLAPMELELNNLAAWLQHSTSSEAVLVVYSENEANVFCEQDLSDPKAGPQK